MSTANVLPRHEMREGFFSFGIFAALMMALFALWGCASTPQTSTSNEIVFQRLQFVDSSRPEPAAFNFPGAPSRTLDVLVWRPLHQTSSRLPLIIYSHGTYGRPDNARHFVEHLVNHGYIVAAPAYPLTSRVSHTNVPNAFVPDVINQPGDVKFIIDQLLADRTLGRLIDANAIGSTGHSLGGVTTYFLSFVDQTRDPRIRANAVIAGGDPILAYRMIYQRSIEEAPTAGAQTPVLFLSSDNDLWANMEQAGGPAGGAPFAAYSRRIAPKYELRIHGGNHIFFRDADGKDLRADGINPDCTGLEAMLNRIPQCRTPATLIPYQRQQVITRDALLSFFDAYLKHDSGALAHLQRLGQIYPETELRAAP